MSTQPTIRAKVHNMIYKNLVCSKRCKECKESEKLCTICNGDRSGLPFCSQCPKENLYDDPESPFCLCINYKKYILYALKKECHYTCKTCSGPTEH